MVNIFCEVTTILVPVAVKVTVPAPADVAVTLLTPATAPKVSEVLALPLASVVAFTVVMLPPPPVTAKVTGAPLIATLLLFFT